MSADAAAMPVKPSKPATTEMRKNNSAHLSIIVYSPRLCLMILSSTYSAIAITFIATDSSIENSDGF